MNWRPPLSATRPGQARPEGELIWAHVNSIDRYLALCDLGARLRQHRPDLTLLISSDLAEQIPAPFQDGQIDLEQAPTEAPGDVRQFLDHWRPDLCIWGSGVPRRTLMRGLRDANIPSVLVDLTTDELPARASRWLPDQRQRLLSAFNTIMTPAAEVYDQLVRAGVDTSKISHTGPLRGSTCPPTYSEEDLNQMQKQLGGRPVWLTTHTRLEELTSILNAHRKALKLLHRLLLIVSLDNWSDLEAARAIIRGCGLNMADWDTGEEPEELTQVLLCDADDLGLWYRLAPVCLMAGSLERRFVGHNPLDAAALGSAIMYGKGNRGHADLYRQLTQAGAAVQVRSMGELADEVLRLSASDKAAEMALAGWRIVTEGAEATDHLLEVAQELLDVQEVEHETA